MNLTTTGMTEIEKEIVDLGLTKFTEKLSDLILTFSYKEIERYNKEIIWDNSFRVQFTLNVNDSTSGYIQTGSLSHAEDIYFLDEEPPTSVGDFADAYPQHLECESIANGIEVHFESLQLLNPTESAKEKLQGKYFLNDDIEKIYIIEGSEPVYVVNPDYVRKDLKD